MITLGWPKLYGVELRVAMIRLGISREQFAVITGKNVATISQWTSGKKAVPAIVDVLLDLMAACPERTAALVEMADQAIAEAKIARKNAKNEKECAVYEESNPS